MGDGLGHDGGDANADEGLDHDYGKPIEGFTTLTTSLEPIDADLGATETATGRFFVCSASAAPRLATDEWQLEITGDAVAKPATVDYHRLQSLPPVELTAWLECAGNGRTMFTEVDGQVIPPENAHTHWTLRAMGLARWQGARLSDVLGLAELASNAAFVAPVGLDNDNTEGEPAKMCLPLAKALDPGTIIATHMNGQPLLPAHGAPVRLVVPGWVGAYSMKWLGRLEISSTWVGSWRADHYYVHRRPDGTIIGPVTSHPVKSNLAMPYPATLGRGPNRLMGYARSGNGTITGVEWSLNGGRWQPARLDDPVGRHGWTVFNLDVTLTPGSHILKTRARDSTGAIQPDHQPFHPFGVLWHSVIPHRISVE